MQEAAEIDIIPAIKTDHSAVILNILLQFSFNNLRGPSYWKFNNSLLYDKSYVELIQREVNLILTDPPPELRYKHISTVETVRLLVTPRFSSSVV